MNLYYAKAKNGELIFDNKKEIREYLLSVENKPLTIRVYRDTGIRTSDQNRAMHKYFNLLATALNDAGLNVQHILSKKIELDWTPNMIKEILWRDVQKRLFGKTSTKDLDKMNEITLVYDTLNRHLGEKFELESIPFPCDPNKN